ncbi:MAG TPA: transposase [Tissierellia bacterium]|nr:transposase [Tissierellia bacterium]
MLSNYFEEIIAHATNHMPKGKMKGINNKTKLIPRQAYGLSDDHYFFLRLFDVSRNDYIRNPSHKVRFVIGP